MCMQVLVALPSPFLPLWSDYEARKTSPLPIVTLEELEEVEKNHNWVAPMRARFSLPFIYFISAHEMCACGFRYDNDDLASAKEDYLPLDVRQSFMKDYENRRCAVRALNVMFEKALQNESNAYAELFAYWDGNENLPDLPPRDVTPAVSGGDEFAFTENQLWRVRLASDGA